MQKVILMQCLTENAAHAASLFTVSVMQVAFSGIGSLSGGVISNARESVESQLVRNKAQYAMRLEALLCPPKLSPQHSMSSMASELSTIKE